uniref:Uncharacterized protein n=1 Tax=Octopus bimaculoides TaxID=37653 RepID=A0A0L8FH69_OCTBM
MKKGKKTNKQNNMQDGKVCNYVMGKNRGQFNVSNDSYSSETKRRKKIILSGYAKQCCLKQDRWIANGSKL